MPDLEILKLIPPQDIAFIIIIWWQQKTIARFVESQPKIAESMAELSTLINVLLRKGKKE